MKPTHALFVALFALTACGGNPFAVVDPNAGKPPVGTDGTTGASAKSPISRVETKVATAGKDYGNGFAEGFKLNVGDPNDTLDDTFEVDGLAFDGENVYQQAAAAPAELGPYRAFEGDATYTDPETGAVINQFDHRAIYGVSDESRTSFAIVRTGAYIPYGFGGFVYQRAGGVTLPTKGQAAYTGNYAALRDFNGLAGLEYATGDMQVAIDFADFNDGKGVAGVVTNRKIFDIDGNEVTSDVLDALNAGLDPTNALVELPTLVFAVGPGVLNAADKAAGELAGTLGSYYTDGGAAVVFESGKYYGLLSDNGTLNAGEIVGVIVVEGKDPRVDGVTVRETGGFILSR